MSDVKDERFPESALLGGRRRETARRETGMKPRIVSALRDGPKTVPQIAAAIGHPEREVLWWLMGCVRYGDAEPTGETTPEGYPLYRAQEEEA